jgi:hypothetical protein
MTSFWLLPEAQIARLNQLELKGFKFVKSCLRLRPIISLLLKALFPGNWSVTLNMNNINATPNMV